MGNEIQTAEEFNVIQAKQFYQYDNEEVSFMFEKDDFEKWLKNTKTIKNGKRAKATIYKTMREVNRVFEFVGGQLSKKSIIEMIQSMKDNDYNATYINGKNNACRTYANFLSQKYNNANIKTAWEVGFVNVAKKQFIDNIINRADYEFLLAEAKEEISKPNLYLGIKLMGTTGVRFVELVQIKVEHIKLGYIDVLGKGAKMRRIYIPKTAQTEILGYLTALNVDSGYVIRRWAKTDKKTYLANTRDLDDYNEFLGFKRAYNKQLLSFGKRLGLDEKVLHPHGFRHFFAKEFLKHRLDISLLADLLGHSSLEITRIYLKMTSREQADIVNEVVTW